MINYVNGDATSPQTSGNVIIAHVCNDIGAWGRGFVLALTQKWPKSEQFYRRWYQEQERCLVNPELSTEVTMGVLKLSSRRKSSKNIAVRSATNYLRLGRALQVISLRIGKNPLERLSN